MLRRTGKCQLGSILSPFVSTFGIFTISSVTLGISSGVSRLLFNCGREVDLLVVEQVNEDIPRYVLVVFASEDEDFSGKEPEDHRDGLGQLVVARNADVDELQVAVQTCQGNHGDVGVAGLNDRLSVRVWVDDDDQSWLSEVSSLLVGQGTRNPSRVGSAVSLGVVGELDGCSLSGFLG